MNNSRNSYHVLILCSGRRVELIQCFQRAARKLNICSTIVAGDCEETAPSLYFADKTCMLPRISSPDYIDSIIAVCNKEDIALVVPTIDTDLLLLAKNRDKIENATSSKVLISDAKVVEVCRDKIKTQRFLEANGLLVPHMYNHKELENQELKYPLFIKPKDGSSSINAFKVHDREELETYLRLIKNPIVQDCMEGEEYTVDAFLNFESDIITAVPRCRIATRCGEISKGRIIKDREIITEVKRLLTVLKPIGQITVQCMKTSKGVEFIEINPRFGGGAPMSIASGADSCENLYRLLMGEDLEYNEAYTDNLLFLRFDRCICLDENMRLIGGMDTSGELEV